MICFRWMTRRLKNTRFELTHQNFAGLRPRLKPAKALDHLLPKGTYLLFQILSHHNEEQGLDEDEPQIMYLVLPCRRNVSVFLYIIQRAVSLQI